MYHHFKGKNMDKSYLMLKTADERCFFTHQNNYLQIVEFAKTCSAEISVVKAHDVKVLDLDELAKSICNHGSSPKPDYELEEIQLTKPEIDVKRTRAKLLVQATIIAEYVNDAFLKGEIVTLKDLENKFSEFDLSKAALCNHITRSRSDLTEKGYTIKRLKKGQYQLQRENQ